MQQLCVLSTDHGNSTEYTGVSGLKTGYVTYMQQLPDESQHSKHAPPPLLVMGVETIQVEKQPHGYCFVRMSEQDGTTMTKSDRLVTIDKVWQLDDMLLETKTRRLQDVCLSFALFKLLRCRFARYTIADAGFHKVYNFFCHVLLKDGDGERVLGVIVDELSFLHDYYYSSLPISYPNRWLPILSIFISLCSIGYCLLFAYGELASWLPLLHSAEAVQGYCTINCIPTHSYADHKQSSPIKYSYGSIYFNLVPIYLLFALVVLTEAKEIASYIFSDWTKVALVSHYVNHASWQQSPILRKWVGCVLRCICKPLKHWQDKMNQCSILVLHPRKTPIALLRCLIPIPDRNKKVPTPRAVKASVIDALRIYEECRSNGMSSLHRSQQPQIQVNDSLIWTFSNTKDTADIMLVCHIATSILEVRSHPRQPLSDHKIVATHLSRYCVYLVAFSPELLPDDDGWCKTLYKAVKKDAERALAGGIGVSTPDHEAEYQKLVELLSAEPRHDVLKNGARLGKQLAELVEGGEETSWKVLASFWSKMILYVAPSDDMNAHAEAIARGGELITLLWALVTHAGIATRPDGTTATTDSNPVPMF